MKALQSRKSSTNGSQLHPNSRRAKQLQRIELRTKKLDVESKVRRSGEVHRVDRHLYFVHALPEDLTSVSLPELHQILQDYINRNDDEAADLVKERSERAWRKGEGKSKREVELDNGKIADDSEYRSGFVIPDLTLAGNVFIARQWTTPLPTAKDPKGSKGGDPSFLGRIRMIRLFKDDPNNVVVEKEGAREGEWGTGEGEVEMGEVESGDEDVADDEEIEA